MLTREMSTMTTAEKTKRIGWSLGIVGALVLTLAAVGCNRFGDFCAAATDCEDGNEADADACRIQVEAEQDRASLYGCDQWFDEYWQCYEDRATCRNGNYGLDVDDCANEDERYSSCMSE